jgi:hypothetical protein
LPDAGLFYGSKQSYQCVKQIERQADITGVIIMRVSIVLGALGVAMALSSCQTLSPEERRARDETTCRGYGFRPNTDQMAGCLLDLDLDRRADARAWQAQSSRDMFYRPVVVERRIIVQNR